MGNHAKGLELVVGRRERGPIRAGRDGTYLLCIDSENRRALLQLLGELRDTLLEDSQVSDTSTDKLRRLFPTAYHDDPESDIEYQRLMRGELMASRLDSISVAGAALERTPDDDTLILTPHELDVFTRSINNLRLVLGTMLDVQEGEDFEEENDDPARHHYHLYSYLGWLLDWAVTAQTGALQAD
ncbi:MAG: DUF2017 family protein [Ilumatobacteraceae bacterium]